MMGGKVSRDATHPKCAELAIILNKNATFFSVTRRETMLSRAGMWNPAGMGMEKGGKGEQECGINHNYGN